MKKQKLITHPGSAHFDEFFAISLILATHDEKEFEIFRRDPNADELSDPLVWVVDIGGQYETKLRNFDHHQDLNTRASFVIVAEHLNLASKLKIFDWFDFKDKIDRFGPVKVGQDLGTDKLSQTYSPFEEWFLNYFAKQPNECIHLMKLFGKNIIKNADELSSGIQFWKNSTVYHIKNKTILVGKTDDTTGVHEYCNSLERPFEITISYDKRGKGWTLRRYNDDPTVDFSKISEHRDIKFAHMGGFIAKTKDLISIENVLKLVELAIL